MDNIKNISDLLCKVDELTKKYAPREIESKEKGINVFQLISNIYHRENLHSDVISFFINPENNPQDYEMNFKNFITLINKKKNVVDVNNYKNYKVYREKGNIDILIEDEDSNRAIIIENKINNAVDMERQLPRYCDFINGRELDCIIYLSLDGYKNPSQDGWKQYEIEEIESKLILIGAVSNETEQSDICFWLKECLKNDISPKNKFIMEDYIDLLTKLRTNMINMNELKEFKNSILKNDRANYEIALKIKELVDKLGYVLSDEIKTKCDNKPIKEPFKKLSLEYNGWMVVFDEWFYENSKYKYCLTVEQDENKPEEFKLRFFDKNNNIIDSKIITIIEGNGFRKIENDEKNFYRYYSIFEENKMLEELEKMFETFKRLG